MLHPFCVTCISSCGVHAGRASSVTSMLASAAAAEGCDTRHQLAKDRGSHLRRGCLLLGCVTSSPVLRSTSAPLASHQSAACGCTPLSSARPFFGITVRTCLRHTPRSTRTDIVDGHRAAQAFVGTKRDRASSVHHATAAQRDPDPAPARAPQFLPKACPEAARASAPPSNPSCRATTPSGTPRAYAPRAAASQRTRVRSSRWSCRGARRRQPGPAGARAGAPSVGAQAACERARRPPHPTAREWGVLPCAATHAGHARMRACMTCEAPHSTRPVSRRRAPARRPWHRPRTVTPSAWPPPRGARAAPRPRERTMR